MSLHRSAHARPPLKRPDTGADTAALPRFTLSGDRRKDHFQIDIDGEGVELTHAALKAFVKLIVARGSTGSGFVHVPRVTVHRLRQALDHAFGELGDRLIETGCREEYRLTLHPDQLHEHVALEPSFFELEELQVFSKDQAAALHRLCRILEPL